MKKLWIGLAFLACMACEEAPVSEKVNDMIAAEGLADFDCVNGQADNPPALADARNWIVGKWQLKGIIAMLPATEVPDIKIEFMEDGGVFVTLNDENVFTDAYSVIEQESNGYKSIQLIGDNLMTESEYAIPRGTLRICENEMLIDQGMAFDAPAYLLRRIK